jgi:VWFA-related protein
MRYFIPVASFLVLAFWAFGQQPAQQPEQVKEGERPVFTADTNEMATIKVDVEIVNVLCSVRDKQGGLIGNLEQQDFVLSEDGTDQEIRYFARETNLPLTIGLLIDVSRSQEQLIEIEKQAGYRFFTEVLTKKDLAFLISFGADAELLQDMTSSPELLRDGLDDLRLSGGVGGMLPGPVPTANPKGTILYDAIFLGAEDMLKKEVGRKVLVVITDGVDYGSSVRKDRAIEAAQRSDAIIYSIYYADPRYQQGRNGYGVMKQISQDTGGSIYEVSRRSNLSEIFERIQEEMRSQYSIGYYPTNAEKDGSFRRIKIKTNQKGTKVQARRGYYASKKG